MKCQILFNISGLFLDFIGVLLLVYYGNKLIGYTTSAEVKHNKIYKWLNIALVLIVIGFFLQLIGNISYFVVSP